MNVLVVTNAFVKRIDNNFFCSENLFFILKRFSILGNLILCATEEMGNSTNVCEFPLSDITRNVFILKKSHIISEQTSNKIIEECVKKSDLIIGYVPCFNAYIAYNYAKKYNKKIMSYVVGCPWDALWNYNLIGKIIAPHAYFLLRKNLKISDFALYVTEHFLQQRYPCPGISCGCSDVRINNIDENVLSNRLHQLKNFSEEQIVNIATIASYSVKYKGQHFVIKALAHLKKLGITKFHYYLIGGGNKTRLKELAEKLDVSELVHFEGIIPHSEILKKLDEMHVYIQPSLQEGLPRSVVEAMSRGLTCICADTGAMPELIESEYIVKRKSVEGIVDMLKKITQKDLINQAKRNFDEACKYKEDVLAIKRNQFFDIIKKDMEKNNETKRSI